MSTKYTKNYAKTGHTVNLNFSKLHFQIKENIYPIVFALTSVVKEFIEREEIDEYV